MNRNLLLTGLLAFALSACTSDKPSETSEKNTAATDSFNFIADRFADIQVLRYRVKGFEELPLNQKKLAYYLYMAGMSGRDIFFDQKYKYNLQIRKTIENILNTYTGDKSADEYKKFEVFCKQFFFANGLHHHYSNDKFTPEFSFEYFASLVQNSDPAGVPLDGATMEDFMNRMKSILFDPSVDPKCVDLSPDIDNVKASAVNFYEGVTQQEVEKFYASKNQPGVKNQPSWGLNSKVVKENGKVAERVWKTGGMYHAAMEKMVYWLEQALTVTENEIQRNTLQKLINFYKSGNLKDYDDYCISWVSDTASRIDIATGFVEMYRDPLHKKGSYESVLSMKDMEATKRIAAIAKEAQWFEDHSPIMDGHKKKNVQGISAKVITVINECADAAPSTPVGINLPNQEWIREQHGSKSVSLGNIVEAYNYARGKSPMIDEFGATQEVIDRYKKYASIASDLHTDMHEVIGHASGKINEGVGSTDVTLKNYASTLEEARADLVALYYIPDKKLIEIGVMPSEEVAKAQYDYYIINGLMTQLFRIKPGNNIEQAHMRNRQTVALWAYEHGKNENVIEKMVKDNKTYFRINDYEKLRNLFGQLLTEIQRIKSEGDFNAGKNLVETYGAKADQQLLAEVHERYKKLDIAPYMGFIQPVLQPQMNGSEITDVKISYPDDFLRQMLDYGKEFSFLPVMN